MRVPEVLILSILALSLAIAGFVATPGVGEEPAAPAVGSSPARNGVPPGGAATLDNSSLRVLVFYYDWYGHPSTDGYWIHWDEAGHQPPDDIASAFYPALGPYSSADPDVLQQHMKWIRGSGAGVLVYSWWGPNTITDQHLPLVLDQASRFGLKVAIHLEPGAYHTSPAAVIQAAADLKARFSSHPAFLDRFHIFLATEFTLDRWRAAMAANHPAIFLAQTTNAQWMDVFDGLYQYDGSAHLSTDSWASLAALARNLGKIFVPNVAPGYDETRAAGGRAYLTVDRENGARYDRLWAAALAAGVDFVAITSFNEWHEGTQIEPAIPKAGYKDYGGMSPNYYIERTFHWVSQFLSSWPPPPPTPPPPSSVPAVPHRRFYII